MKYKELQGKNDTELRELRGTTEASLRTFRFSIAGSALRNVREGRTLRRTIARINTLLTQRARGTQYTTHTQS